MANPGTDTATEFGVIVGTDGVAAARAAGADYVEPTIVGNLVVPAPSGGWMRSPHYDGDPSPSFAILFPRDLRLADPDFPVEEIDAYLEAAMAVVASAARPGAKIVFGSGAARNRPDGVDVAVARALLARVLTRARDVAARHQLRVLLEPLHTGETNMINSIAEAVAFLDEFAITDVQVVADLFHIMTAGEDLAVVREQGARIGHAHIADSGRTPPGQGDWPLPAFLNALRAGGYTGPVSVECHFTDLGPELAGALAHLRELDAARAVPAN
ncbi:sugar phosphate isomerase/epimerase [Occultella glacieicola]|uniref:Sugar phosphate isomerase/epimerase n=1 Tax=Occultella glacieicola TaxID=2518684 RepID=A0ABY2DXC4_9MICO|nr:sugar phosphate isomerase/epimerase family protein [Occultella glacieicola]TDE88792.1 sugar phosphate isomerase/epimerase [Occultella glacieicola]